MGSLRGTLSPPSAKSHSLQVENNSSDEIRSCLGNDRNRAGRNKRTRKQRTGFPRTALTQMAESARRPGLHSGLTARVRQVQAHALCRHHFWPRGRSLSCRRLDAELGLSPRGIRKMLLRRPGNVGLNDQPSAAGIGRQRTRWLRECDGCGVRLCYVHQSRACRFDATQILFLRGGSSGREVGDGGCSAGSGRDRRR